MPEPRTEQLTPAQSDAAAAEEAEETARRWQELADVIAKTKSQ